MQDDKIALTTQCACLDKDKNAWIFSNDFNALFYLNRITQELSYITSFEQEAFLCRQLYTEMILYKEKLFCIPCLAKCIAVYSIRTGELHYIPIREENYVVYFNVVKIEANKILLYPVVYSKSAYFFDLDTERYESISLDYKEREAMLHNSILRGKAYWNGKAYFAIDRTNELLLFDVKNYQICYQKINNKLIFDVLSDGRYLYIMSEDGCSYEVYQGETYLSTCKLTKSTDLSIKEIKFEDMKYVINEMVSAESIVSIPMRELPICLLKEGKLTKISLDWSKIHLVANKIQAFSLCLIEQENIILCPYHSNTMVTVNLKSGEVQYMDLTIEMKLYSKMCEKAVWSEQELEYPFNNWYLSLRQYIELIKLDRFSNKENISKRNGIGESIYKELISKEK